MAEPEKLEYKEPLILRSMGAYGYLKFPRGFQDRYRHDKERVPDPEAFLEEVDGTVRLSFVWNADELKASKKEE